MVTAYCGFDEYINIFENITSRCLQKYLWVLSKRKALNYIVTIFVKFDRLSFNIRKLASRNRFCRAPFASIESLPQSKPYRCYKWHS